MNNGGGWVFHLTYGDGLASWLGLRHITRAIKVAPSAPRARESFMNMPSETVIQDSD